jgi:zinc and cadmium transporter
MIGGTGLEPLGTKTALLILLSVLGLSLISLLGLLTLSLKESRLKRLSPLLVSFAVGALLGDAFIHLIPEAFAITSPTPNTPSLLMLAGLMTFFLLERLILRRKVRSAPSPGAAGSIRTELIAITMVGDSVHNFIDGVLICASYLISPALGLSTTLAVVCHELPKAMADLGILLQSGLRVRQAVFLNLMSASAAIAGAAALLLFGQELGQSLRDVFIPLTAGGFIYIACADLMPELERAGSDRTLTPQLALVACGVGVMQMLAWLE